MAVKGWAAGPVSRSNVPLRISILDRISGDEIALPTPLRIKDGISDVYKDPMLYITQEALLRASITRGLAGMVISWP